MLILHLSTFSAMSCRPASGHPATALFAYKWGGFLGRGKLGSASRVAGFNPIFFGSIFSEIFVTISGLLNRDQLYLHPLSGTFRWQPGLT
ncbi:MAG: hypothetical protein NW224_23475 [Leptolyngbyaceae cyanobacterium bins.302]|nr:hypothetical protein [Leptolyngbyaceae cyanobacterium bins.302]